ncbi:filament-like plant protein 4 [Typha latifolia]|uniref:filament-like plant protein 4 n=1 Tax=Typha latifolia TaxID=4733 RepID=UPI003C2EB688
MDRRSWPWKKKSSEKASTADSSNGSLPNSGGNQADQENTKVVNYVQISPETYAHFTDLEEEVKVLNEKLATAQSEMTTKENLVKQHAKVAEEAVSGWEKAEAEASVLKHQLESVTLSRLAAEERSSHLDGALKECMKQIRNVKEESEQKLHDVVFLRTKEWEEVKSELEARIIDFDQELLKASADNAALSRSLQERSNMLMKISEEKSQADAEIEVLKSGLQSCEREISSLKYEIHIVSKELEIRNEEKNMSLRSADVANKQHLEDVKKITKLEAECQRLRGLVRKKLPGPAALAQMKLEVENLGRDYGENRLRRSPAKNTAPHHTLPPAPEFAFENFQPFQKDNEVLTARLLAMEEETKMIKEALSKRNSELQAARNMCAKTTSKLRSMEMQFLALNQQKSPSHSNMDIRFDVTLSQNGSNGPSLSSMSEDGIDDEGSCSESWATALISELSQFKKGKEVDKGKAENSNNLELMDDFLEMERLACLPAENNNSEGAVVNMKFENADNSKTLSVVSERNESGKESEPALLSPERPSYSGNQSPHVEFASSKMDSPLLKLQSRIASVFDSQLLPDDVGKVLENISYILRDIQEELPQHSLACIIDEPSVDVNCDEKECRDEVTDNGTKSKLDGDLKSDTKHALNQELWNAISQLHNFVKSIGREVEIQCGPCDYHGLREKIELFSTSVKKVPINEKSLHDFIIALSYILSETSEINFMMSNVKGTDVENNNLDCVDKVTLLENKVAMNGPIEANFTGRHSVISHSSSDPEFEGPINSDFGSKTETQKCSLEEYEQLKSDKTNLEIELVECNEMLEHTKLQLTEAEKNMAELRSQLAASQKTNSLAETQLKCMAESYNSLESHTLELEAEMNFLKTKLETLNVELLAERQSHQEDLTRYKELQEQMERKEKSSMCSDPDTDIKMKQEREIATATEKLAECQETIFLLGRQLQSLRPPMEPLSSSPNNRQQFEDDLFEDEPGTSGDYPRGVHSQQLLGQFEFENAAANLTERIGAESPFDGYNSHMSPSDTEASPFPKSPISSKRQKHRSSRSASSFPLTNSTPEKHGRGFSRFFSKGKNEH